MLGLLSRYRTDFRANLRLATPIMAGHVGQIAVNMADNLMVGKLGATALAGLAFALAVFSLFFITSLGLGTAMQPLISEADGARNKSAVSIHFKHGLVVNLAAAVLSILLIELLVPFLYDFGQSSDAVDLLPMVAILIGNVLNIFLNYVLIYGNFGAPAMGVEGAAIGTMVARVFMLVLLFALMWRSKWVGELGASLKEYLKEITRYDLKKERFRAYFKLGLPNAVQMICEIGAFAGAAIIMGMIGEKELAAHQITINLISATFMICMGLATSATIRVGNNLGRNDAQGMRDAGISSMIQVMVFMSVCGLLLFLSRHFLPTLYIDDMEVVGIAASLFLVAALFQLSDGLQVTAIGALRGMQDVIYPTVVTFIAYICVGLPFSYLAAFHLDLGYFGVWIGLLIGLTISAYLNTRRFMRLSRVEAG